MRRFLGVIGLGAVLVMGVGFAALNAGRSVTIDVGLFTLFRVPVTFVAFGGMVVGMSVVLVAGINADLKVRALLRKAALTHPDDVDRRTIKAPPPSEPYHREVGAPHLDPHAHLGTAATLEAAQAADDGPPADADEPMEDDILRRSEDLHRPRPGELPLE